MPGAVITPGDVSEAWSSVADSLSWDIFDATAEVATAGAIAGDGAGAGLTIVAGGLAADPIVDVGAIIVGTALLIVAFAVGILLLRPLGWLLGHIPVVGGAIEDALDNASNAVWNFVKGLAGDALRGIWWFLKALWSVTLGFPIAVAHTLSAVANFEHWIANDQVPGVQQNAYNAANNAEARADAHSNSLYGAAINFARSLFGSALAQAAQLFGQAVSWATGLFNRAEADIAGALQKAEGVASQLFHQAEADIRTEVGAAEAKAAQLFNQVEGDLHAAEQQAQRELGAAVQQLTGLFQGALTATTALLGQEITQTATQAATATQTVEDKLNQYLDRCGIPLCDNLSSLSNDTRQLLNLFDDVAIAALIRDCIRNPAGVAEDIRDLVVGPMRDVAQLVMG